MKRKNIIVMTTHDLGQHLHAYGVETVQTPCLDRMAAEGVLFENNFCTSPGCSPSRAAIFTGRYSHSNGVLGLTHQDFLWHLRPGEKHLAQTLREHGYDTCLIGMMHENPRMDNVGYRETVLGSGGSYAFSDDLQKNETAPDLADFSGRIDFYLNQVKDAEQPFFLSIGTFEPHRPYHFKGCLPDREKGVWIPPYIPQETSVQRAAAEKEFAELQGSIRHMDRAVGRLLDRLEELGLKDDTLVLFTSDHGIAMPRAKCALYDPGIETPLILWGGGIPAGQRFPQLVSNVDYFPSLLDWADFPVAENVQGHSFYPLLQGGDYYTPRTEIFAEKTYHRSYDPIRCIRTEKFKYIINFEYNTCYDAPSDVQQGDIYRAAVEQYMAVRPRFELYDLEADPWEQNNLASDPQKAVIQNGLHERLITWMRETGDPLLQGPIRSIYHEQIVDQCNDLMKGNTNDCAACL